MDEDIKVLLVEKVYEEDKLESKIGSRKYV